MAKAVKLPANTLRYWAADAYRAWMYRGGPCVPRVVKTVQGVELTVQVLPGQEPKVKLTWASPGKVNTKTIKAAKAWLHG